MTLTCSLNGPSKTSSLTLISNEQNPSFGYVFRALDHDDKERRKNLVFDQSLGDDQYRFNWVIEDRSKLDDSVSNIILMIKNQHAEVDKMVSAVNLDSTPAKVSSKI